MRIRPSSVDILLIIIYKTVVNRDTIKTFLKDVFYLNCVRKNMRNIRFLELLWEIIVKNEDHGNKKK